MISMESTEPFRAPHSMTPDELGDNLAQLVWETFSDFLAREDVGAPIPELHPVGADEGEVDGDSAEEALIFFMWAHTRGAQQAFLGRAPDDRIRKGLDALHRAVFDDMAEHGTPRAQLPIFEQRVSARYAEYHQAAAESDALLGTAVCHHLAGTPDACRSTAAAITQRARAVASPLRDFLEDVELVD